MLGLLPSIFVLWLAAPILGRLTEAADPLRNPDAGWLLGVPLAAFGLWGVGRFILQVRAGRRTPVVLSLGPEGIFMPDVGQLPWDDVRDISVAVRWSQDDGSAVRHWLVVIVPNRGARRGQDVTIKNSGVLVSLEKLIAAIEPYHDVTGRPPRRAAVGA